MYYIRKAASILWYAAIAYMVGCTVYEEYVCAGEDPGNVNGVLGVIHCPDMFYYPNFNNVPDHTLDIINNVTDDD